MKEQLCEAQEQIKALELKLQECDLASPASPLLLTPQD